MTVVGPSQSRIGRHPRTKVEENARPPATMGGKTLNRLPAEMMCRISSRPRRTDARC